MKALAQLIVLAKKSMTFAFVALFTLSVVLPLLWMTMTSVKSSPEIFASPWGLPTTPHWDNFANAWKAAGIAHYFANSLIVTTATLIFLIPIGAMAAYIFARYPFPG